MQLFGKTLGDDLVVVAEIGVNHEGDAGKALELVDLMAEAGADAVKFQTYTAERFVSALDPDRLARVKRFGLDEAAHRQLAERAREKGIGFFSTPVTEDVIPFLNTLCPVLKIASGDIDFEPTIRACAETGKPVILSTGLATVDEIDQAVAWFGNSIGGDQLRDRLVLMHCVSAYPTPMDQANVRAVPYLADRYGLHVGYSNHVVGPEACLAAVALGADVIEVHTTDQKTGREFRDHSLSMEPADLKAFIATAKQMRAALGQPHKVIQPCEAEAKQAMRKGIVAARELAAGTVLQADDLMFARPANELSATEINTVVGRTLSVALQAGQPVPRDGLS